MTKRPGSLIQVAYAVQKWLWRVIRPNTRGVKVMLFNTEGAIMLIRNSYGRSEQFVLPGGGVRPFEHLHAAAAREVREELGLTAQELEFRSRHLSNAEGKRDEIHLFEALAHGEPKLDGLELVEARWFHLDKIPEGTSPATRRRIEEYLGERQPDGSW